MGVRLSCDGHAAPSPAHTHTHAARWQGALVAVKIIEHMASQVEVERVQRELAHSLMLSHPCVVSTYKVRVRALCVLCVCVHACVHVNV